MPRERSPNSLKAEKLYIDSKGTIELIEIARQLNIPEGTIRSWKNRYKWDDKINNATLQKNNKNKRNVANKKLNRNNKNKEPKQKEILENDNPELTDKQRLFCIYYVKYFNATKAYQKAYECSYNTAMVEGSEHLRKPKIQDQIKKLKADKLKGAMLEPGDVLQKYIDIAFSDITDFLIFGQEEVPVINAFGPVLGKDGEPVTRMVNTVKFRAWANVDGTLISEISQGKDGAKLKLYDKMKALDWLANHMDLLDTATKEKLKLERDKFNADQLKKNGDSKDITIRVTLEDDEL